jgi:hypothetical protein
MNDFLTIGSLDKETEKRILGDIEESIARKKKEGLVTEKDVREIEEMRLRPLPDLLDVQSVYSPIEFD